MKTFTADGTIPHYKKSKQTMVYDYDNWKVLGHICAGMKAHQDYSTSMCIPVINKDGCIVGCDDTNTVQIKYCPFCGAELKENEAVNVK